MEGKIVGYGRRAELVCEFDSEEANVLNNVALAEGLAVEYGHIDSPRDLLAYKKDGSATMRVPVAWGDKLLTETSQKLFDYQSGMSQILERSHLYLKSDVKNFVAEQMGRALRLGLEVDSLANRLSLDELS